MSHEKFSQKIMAALTKAMEAQPDNLTKSAAIALFGEVVASCQTVKGERRRAKSAYQFYVSDPDNRRRVEDASEDKIPYKQVVSILAKEWNLLDDDAKTPWQDKAAAERESMPAKEPPARKRARSAYNFFVQNPGSDEGLELGTTPQEKMAALAARWQGLDAEARAPFEELAKAEKMKFSSEAPVRKRARSGYNFFIADGDAKAKVLEEDPSLKPTAVIARLAAVWKEMTALEKEPFEELARQDREEMGQQSKPVPQRKRPRSAYQFWKDDAATKTAFQEQFPGKNLKEMSKDMKAHWERMPLSEKSPWTLRAEKDRDVLDLQLGKIALQRSTSHGSPPDLSALFA